MQKQFLIIGILAAATAVVLGASGAHALKEKITPEQLAIFEKGVYYQLFHAMALIIAALMFDKYNASFLNYSGYAFTIGIICFSGSLYLLSTKTLLGIESWKFIGPITPIGGLCLIAGWVLMLFSVVKK